MAVEKILKSPVPAPMAWKGKELKGESSWIYCLPRQALIDIAAALENVTISGLPLYQIKREDFPLPSIEPDLHRLLREIQSGRGFALIRGIPLEGYTLHQIETVLWGIGTYFGTALSQNAGGDRLLHVMDRGDVYGDTNIRGYTTRGGQQLHTDTAADLVALLCVRKAKSGGLSRVTSSMAVYNEFLANFPSDYLDQLYRGFQYDRRGEERSGVAPITEQPIPVFTYHSGTLSCFYSHITINQGAKKSGRSLTEFETAVLDAFDEVAGHPEMRLDMDLQPGDLQILNNHTVMHGRTEWVDFDETERKRLMLRLWLGQADSQEWRFKARNLYGSQGQKGIPVKNPNQ